MFRLRRKARRFFFWPTAKQTETFFFDYVRRIMTSTAFLAATKKRVAQEKNGGQAAPCLRHVMKKKGFPAKTCTSATKFHHLFQALMRVAVSR